MRISLAARTDNEMYGQNFRLLHVNIWCGMIFVIRSITAECHVCAVDLALYTFLTLFTQNAAEITLLNFIKKNPPHTHIRETKIVACVEPYRSQPTGMIFHTYRYRYIICIWSTNIFMPFQSLFSLWFICSGESFGTGLFSAQRHYQIIFIIHIVYTYICLYMHACAHIYACLNSFAKLMLK